MRPLLAAAVLLLAAATGVAAAPPEDAAFVLDEVEYLYVTGVNRTETAVLEPGDAASALPIESCAFLQLHPGTPNGILRVHGLQEASVDLDLRVDQFRLPDGERGYAFDQAVTQDGVPAFADVAIAGNGSMRVRSEVYYDPLASTGIEELDRDLPSLLGAVSVLRDGVRDDATGAVLAKPTPGDPEMHVHLRSGPDAVASTITHVFESPGTATPPTEAYGEVHTIQNLKFGGRGTLDVSTSAHAPAGMNELTFTVIAPNGTIVANVTLAPALLADDGATVDFPLDAFGPYLLRVTGSVAFSSYTATLTMAPPPQFDLHFWWESVTYGYQAYRDYRACLDALGSPNSIISTERIVGRPDPPRFQVAYAVLGVAGAVGVSAVAVKLASDQLALSAFRKNK